MFRYIAISWDESASTSSRCAQRLGQEWQTRLGWDAALIRPGLQVFTRGSMARINVARTLPGGLGVILGKLFRRSDLAATAVTDLPLTPTEVSELLHSGGRSLITGFWGRYVAFLQTAPGTTRVVRDPSGSLPCFLIRHCGVSIVFSWLEDALLMLGDAQTLSVNWDALTAHLLRGSLGGRQTSLNGVSQVLPGEALDLHDQSSVLLWSAVETARSPAPYDAIEASALLRQTVTACTQAWASCYDTLLLRLSGGVDSSILLSCLAPGNTLADVICVNYHSPGADSDERRYARMAAVKSGRDLLERLRDPDFKVERVLQVARMPNPVVYIGRMNASMDAALAQAYGASAMFTGAGGDAAFYELLRWWPAADYLQDKGLSAGFAAAAMDAARLGRVSVWRTVALAMAEWLHHDHTARNPGWSFALLTPGVQQQALDLHRFNHPALRDADHLPIGKYMQTVALMHPLGYYDPFEQTSAPELVHPLLSQPVVELCLRLPTYVLTQGGHGRALARRAFAGDLPPEIANRSTKGGMEDHFKAVLQSNLEFVRRLLLEGQLAQQGMLDRAKVEELLSGRPTSLVGSMSQIHGLVAIEAWLSRWMR